MSDPSTEIADLETVLNDLSKHYGKFKGGNKSAGRRARKTAQELKKKLQTMRINILDEQKKSKVKKKKNEKNEKKEKK